MAEEPEKSTTVDSLNTTVVSQNDAQVIDLREKNFDKKLLLFLYLAVMGCMLGYLSAFSSPSDLVLGFFIGQIGAFGGALGNIITGKKDDQQRVQQQRSTDHPVKA